jgi:hypothetical protein
VVISSGRRGCRVLPLLTFVACCGFALHASGQQPAGPVAPAQTGTTPGQTTSPGTPRTQLPPVDSAAPPATSTPAVNADGSPQLPLELQSHGLTYEALTREGITVTFAMLPQQIKDFSILQVTVTNGSLVSWTTKPTDFSFERQDGSVLMALTADDIVGSLLDRASRSDVIKLQLLYENSIYALANYRPTNGYEQRREAAMAQFVNLRFSAAAAASAIVLASVKLKPGDSTDGAVFFELHGKEKSLGAGLLIARTCGQSFSFQVGAEPKGVH